jgi:hypothetical protein
MNCLACLHFPALFTYIITYSRELRAVQHAQGAACEKETDSTLGDGPDFQPAYGDK